MITTLTRIISTAQCDGGPSCTTAPIESPTSAESLASALHAAGWRVEGLQCWCGACERMMEAAGQLPPRPAGS